MAIQTIPQKYKFVCAGCKKEHESESISRPSYWTELHIKRDAYDFQGFAVADASVHRLLCGDCSKFIYQCMNDATEARAALSKAEGSAALSQGGGNDR